MTIELPPGMGGLKAAQAAGMGALVIAPGSASNETFAASATGTGELMVFGLEVDRLSVAASGAASVFVNGTSRAASVVASGTSDVALLGPGVTEVADLDVSGISTTVVEGQDEASQGGGRPPTRVTGSASGLARIMQAHGDCAVETMVSSLPEVMNIL